MKVRAKFKVTGIKEGLSTKCVKEAGKPDRYEECTVKTIEASPVYGNGDPEHENTRFWNASPSGKIELGVISAETAALFVIGKEYYVDFTPAE